MTTDEPQALRWLAGSLDWERRLSTLRRDAAAAALLADVAPGCAPATQSDDLGCPARAGGLSAPPARPAPDPRGVDDRPRRVHVDGGVPTSA